ncbi:MAG: endonuclease domain-containing protein [Streptosporangiaceae bacterium]
MEFAVSTGRRVPGLPSCYKLDLAHPAAKVAIEIDGNSHNTTLGKERDRRKQEWLTGAGWTVLRFSNREVMADTAACARTAMSTTLRLLARTPTR